MHHTCTNATSAVVGSTSKEASGRRMPAELAKPSTLKNWGSAQASKNLLIHRLVKITNALLMETQPATKSKMDVGES